MVRVRDAQGMKGHGYEKVTVRNVWKPIGRGWVYTWIVLERQMILFFA